MGYRALTMPRRALILVHRYLGIPLSALFVLWFASGIVMMYAGGMPRLTPELRLERLPALDLARVELTPAVAARRAGVSPTPRRASLLMVMGRPAYRLDGATVFADDGARRGDIGAAGSAAVASRFVGVTSGAVRHVDTLSEADQWTLAYQRQMPLHKFRVAADAGTELYVSPRSAEVTVLTTRRSRVLAWLGTIPHWLYFASLRVNQPLWSRTVVWLSTLGCLLAVVGLALGVMQFRVRYGRWMRWHYMTGVVFGVFTLTWVFSGLLSMEPYAWTNARGLELSSDVLTGGPLELDRFPAIDPDDWSRLVGGRAVKELEFLRIQDEPYYAALVAPAAVQPREAERLHQPYYVTGKAEPHRLLVAAETLTVRDTPFSAESMLARLTLAAPGVPVVESAILTEYDSYYYSRGRQTPLPVLRVKFADPADTWYYVDPATSRVLTAVHRFSRLERWLFNGLHSLDFAFWYDRRPLWDIGVILLSLGGLASSGIGLWVGFGRVRRTVGRLFSLDRVRSRTPSTG